MGDDTSVIVADTDHIRVKDYIEIGGHDIVYPRWVQECVERQVIVPYEKRHMLFHTFETLNRMLLVSDIYGDSYTQPSTPASIKEIFSGMEVPQASTFDQGNVRYLEMKLFGNEP